MDKQCARYMTYGKQVRSNSTDEVYKLVENMDAAKDSIVGVNINNVSRYELLTAWIKNWEQDSMSFRERFTENIEDCKKECVSYETKLPIADIMPNNTIRFIDTEHNLKFEAPDLSMISIKNKKLQVAYIDEQHFAFVRTGACYHINQFAELCAERWYDVTLVPNWEALLLEKTSDLEVEGFEDTWHVVDTADIDGEKYYFMECHQESEEQFQICVDKYGAEVPYAGRNGFDGLKYFLDSRKTHGERYNALCALKTPITGTAQAAFYLLSFDTDIYEIACKHISYEGANLERIKYAMQNFNQKFYNPNFYEEKKQVVDIAYNLFSHNDPYSCGPCKVTPFEIACLGHPLMELVCNAIYISTGQVKVRTLTDENQKVIIELDTEPYQKIKQDYELGKYDIYKSWSWEEMESDKGECEM